MTLPHACLPWGSPAEVLEIDGQAFDSDSDGLAQAVAMAYATRRRPRCLCRPGGVPMYVARLAQGYVVKRMPDTGSQHAPQCPSFELPAELSCGAGRAVREDPASGQTLLRLDFPMARARVGAARADAPRPPGSVGAAQPRLSLLGLLHFLWEQAGLTQWQPAFEGRRPWATVRRRLLGAAAHKRAAGCELSERLYVPETFSSAALAAIQARRRESWAALAPRDGAQPLMLMLGELKGITPARHGHLLVVKHMPDLGFWIGDALSLAMDRRFKGELALWGACGDARLVMAATFGLDGAGVPAIARVCLMAVTRTWLPVASRADKELVDGLVAEGRAFRKILRYDRPAGERMASVALTDRGEPLPVLFAGEAV